MVTNITSLTGNGLKDWLIQRVTAIYFAAYAFFLIGFFWVHPHIDYTQWHDLFHTVWFQVATILALLGISLHTWIGIWTVTTDYIKCTCIRLSVQMFIVLWLMGQLVWGLMIVWGS